eukprot:TRINITY_DN752_c0_g1_i1.p1 TRINITY_DN752_c0_g1~~TRINITY_DN752_c0_g1_i1.p1  ORF type:complete len:515 (-),score=155.37 TRINITY_DN752_c0_g1_i1:65-1609(-)
MLNIYKTEPKKIELTKRSTPLNISNLSNNYPQKKFNNKNADKSQTNSGQIIPISKGRYLNEFVQEQKLGSGGFGSVYKVLCKLDGEKYAIKKIKIRIKNKSSSEISLDSLPMKTMREVKTLAKLDHKNIVRYYQTWIENEEETLPQQNLNKEFSNDFTPQNSESEKAKTHSNNSSYTSGGNDKTNEIFNFEETKTRKLIFNNFVPNFSNGSNNNSLFEKTNSTSYSTNETTPAPKTNTILNLYIQIKLYPGTLEDYINHPSRRIDQPINLAMIKQIAEALDFMNLHFNICHRDIKPSNLFLSLSIDDLLNRNGDQFVERDDLIKIGDFGLAKNLEEGEDGEISSSTERENGEIIPCSPFIQLANNLLDSDHHGMGCSVGSYHTSGIGTSTYVSPEQGKTDSTTHLYNEKTDIYSLGIITFELFTIFNTKMERSKMISQLRDGIFPSKFLNQYNEISQLISRMMTKDPNLRISAKDIIDHHLFLTNTELTLRKQEKEIRLLRERLSLLEKSNRFL